MALRKQLEALLEFDRQGDTLGVTKLDGLARSVAHLGKIIKILEIRGVALRILNLGVDTSTPTGKLMLNVLGGVAQFERAMMLEWHRDGIARACGCLQRSQVDRSGTLRGDQGTCRQGISMTTIAAKLGIGKGRCIAC
ncbi:recombinase family protein [Methylobacterium sp. R2-1]|uniref:recombinase family protein n=1 Tax=Methylobacterium sp. R2-1 TaxID=2587064 RepID=UPI0017A8CEC9|nr:recombinase family protein [Methylobacterium sp. R2-1]MBB2964640.1 hypothetical protein [Methylobacterium sp. R2-1]